MGKLMDDIKVGEKIETHGTVTLFRNGPTNEVVMVFKPDSGEPFYEDFTSYWFRYGAILYPKECAKNGEPN